MDRAATRQRLESKIKKAVEQAMEAMNKAPKNNIVGGSEVQVGKVMDQLKREVFQELIQNKVDDVEAEARSVFSPPGGPQGTG